MNTKLNFYRYDLGTLAMIKGSLYDLPTPTNISYWWKFGSLLAVFLGIQIVTGLFLSMHYVASMEEAFLSVSKMNREIKGGWFMRFLHVGGASAYFLFLYIHMSRGLWNFSFFTKPLTWNVGVLMLLASMAAAFLGYVLPWGQMSYWGATVITNFFSVIPYMGNDFVVWLWGGFSVKNPTLVRFFSLHFLCPFMVLFLVVVHFFFLHEKGSSNPLNIIAGEKAPIFPHFMFKDMVGFIAGFWVAYMLMFSAPSLVLEEQNFLKANFLVTPEHMQPEWYFLAAYAVLRAVPKKLGGVMALACFVIFFFMLPFLIKSKNYISKKGLYSMLYFFWCFKFLFLTWIGGQPVEDPYVMLSQVGFVVYFSYFLMVPLMSKINFKKDEWL